MNDRYLYRAKRTDDGELVEGNLVWSDDADDDYKAIIIPTTDSNMFTRGGARGDLGFENWCRVDPSTICQCTGIKDKNGKLIFENDIVKFDVYEYEKLVSSTVSEIKWCEELCSLSVVVNKQGIRGTLGHFLDLNKEVEVIGSAIDNLELLEVGE